jgi:hypothetical protein
MSAVRPLLVKAWIISLYSVPTSFLLLFAASYAFGDGAVGSAGATHATTTVALGNRELVVLVAMLGALVVLSIGSAVEYWLDSRKPEVFVRFLAGATHAGVAARLLAAIFTVNGLGFIGASAAYAMLNAASRGAIRLPALTPAGVVLAFATSSLLVVGAAAAGVITAVRRLDRVRMY